MYVHDLKRLLDQAMAGLEANARSQLVLHQFMAGLPPHVSAQLRATGDMKELDRTVERAHLLMAISSQSAVYIATVGAEPGEVQQLKDQVAELTEQVAVLTTRRTDSWQKNVVQLRCFNCDGIGHIQRECPSPRRQRRSNVGPCRACGRFRHLARDCRRRQGNENGTPVVGGSRPSNQ